MTPPTQPTTNVPVEVDGEAHPLPGFPSPKIPIPQPPYDESKPHPLPDEKVGSYRQPNLG